MNKDLMMKAAIQFKGVWPDQEETHLYKFHYGRFVTGMEGGTADVVCTREQFEDFVESLFDGAPVGATHFKPNALSSWYKISNAENKHYLGKRDEWVISESIRGGFLTMDDLIPRPVKKLFIGDTPQQLKEGVTPWVPEIGEECEAMWGATEIWGKVTYVGDFMFYEIHKNKYLNLSQIKNLQFRPLRTERELFTEQATKDYLDQVGSDAVNEKWFSRIFGVMYDAGYRKN